MKYNVSMDKVAKKSKRNYGHLSITSGDLPSVKDAKIGDKIVVAVEIEVTGLIKPDSWDVEEYGMKKGEVKLQSDILSIKENKNASK